LTWAVNPEEWVLPGLYQWQTVEDAEHYATSIAVKFMTRRSIPESVQFKIIDQSKERYWAFR
jgi:hypothetical protein